ncbi:hypothetical protein [Haloferax sp. DFSO52]|uniref:hypothetical protein n=1 Tax=Haloferax sp. DFSO52 TaxID=3388505 RepID=UPI003A84F60C
MPVASYAPIFHEQGDGIGKVVEPMAYYNGHHWPSGFENWGDVQFMDTNPFGFAASWTGDETPEEYGYQGSLGLLPTPLPDGAKPNSLTIVGHSGGSVVFELFSQSHMYLPPNWNYPDEVGGEVTSLARLHAGWANFHSTEARTFERSGPHFIRTVPIRNVNGGVIDNYSNWYGLYANAIDDQCYITGVKIIYDEDDSEPLRPVLEREVEIDRIPDDFKKSIELDRETILDVDAVGYTFIGVAQDGELIELEQSVNGPSTFVLPPGAYEVWTDGHSTEITEWPYRPNRGYQPSPRNTDSMGDDPNSAV